MVAVMHTPKEDRLVERSRFLADIMRSIRVMKYGGTLVKEELSKGGFTEPFLPSGKADKFKEFIVNMSRGIIPAHIPQVLEDIGKRKQEDQDCFLEIKENLRAEAEKKFGAVSSRNHDFEDFYLWVENSVRENNPERFVNYPAGASKSRFVYANAMTRGLAAMTYVNVFENRGVKRSDGFDIQHLVYLVGMDLLVSGDGKMRKVCELTFGGQLRAFAPDDFLNELKGEEAVCPSTGSGRTAPVLNG